MYSICHFKMEHHTFVDFIDLDGEFPPDHLYGLELLVFLNSMSSITVLVNFCLTSFFIFFGKVNTLEHSILKRTSMVNAIKKAPK